LTGAGLTVAGEFAGIDVLYGSGTLGQVLSLRSRPGVTYLEADRKLEYHGDTGPWATRARAAYESALGGPYYDTSGAVLTGSGVGVAVVDSGIDATHPDLAERVVKNFKVVCSTPGLISTATGMCFGPTAYAEAPDTDTTGGHGTHVAGIVAGDGTASNGTFRGVATGADLYGYGTGEAISVLYAAEAFQHILDNNDTFTPRIRVVNNSWGDPAGSDYDPNSVLSKLTRELVASGVTVVYSAGNGDDTGYGGSGDEPDDYLSSTGKDPTPGVITAANYDDHETGSRNGELDSSSSRGKKGLYETYPDLSAPGALITSTCRPTKPVCDLGPTPEWAPFYTSIGGTSMSAPHIAGAAALLYQARPDLTPAQVEDVLLDTAYKYTAGGAYESDPQNPGASTSFDKGAGLLDVPAALDALGVTKAGFSNDGSQAIFAGDGGDYPGPGVSDISSLDVAEGTDGLTYTLGVRDVQDLGPFGNTSFRLMQNVDGEPFVTSITVNAAGATPSAPGTSNTAVATSASTDPAADTVTFFVPFSNLGNPPPASPAHNVSVYSYQQLIADMAPGGLGAEFVVHPEYGDSYTIFRGADVPVVEPTATSLSLTTASPSGQYSDSATVGARLTEAGGSPLAGRAVTFELAGSQGVDTVTATTDEAGAAVVDFKLTGKPETRVLSVSYAGEEGVFTAADTGADFAVLKDESNTGLAVTGTGSKRTLVARVTDLDSSTTPITGEIIEFFSGGTSLGIARTDSTGTATFTPPAAYRTGKGTFEAVFTSNDFYLGSRGSASS
jgi:serine protease AprX